VESDGTGGGGGGGKFSAKIMLHHLWMTHILEHCTRCGRCGLISKRMYPALT